MRPLRSTLLALATLYLPQLLPLALGPLTECSHCVGTYGRLFALLPGMLPAWSLAIPAGLPRPVLLALASGITLAVLVLLTLLAHRSPRTARWLLPLTALASASNALAVASALRI